MGIIRVPRFAHYLAILLLVGGASLLATSWPAAGAREPGADATDVTPTPNPASDRSVQPVAAPFGPADLIGGKIAISTGTSWQRYPRVATNVVANEYLVVWEDNRSGSYDIYGQRVGGNGVLLGGSITIAAATHNQLRPTVAWNAAVNEYLVVWSDYRSGSGYVVFGQRVRANGVLIGKNFAISTAATALGYEPALVVWNATENEYLVVWLDIRNGSGDIYGQRVGASGVLLGGNFAISPAASDQWYPAVAWNAATNEYLVVWEDRREGSDIYGQRVEAHGALLGTNFSIAIGTNNLSDPAVTWNTVANEYLVIWQDYRPGAYHHIYGQRSDASGALLDKDFVIGATGNLWDPAVVWNAAASEYLVTWRDDLGSNVYDVVDVQRLNASGALLGNKSNISTEALYPDISWNAVTNEYLVVWLDTSSDSYGDIYGQRIGYPLPPTPTPTATRTATPTRTPTITPTPTPRVELGKAVDRNHANPGDSLNYTISLDNRRPNAAAVRITDTLPLPVMVVPASLSAGALYDPAGHSVLWQGMLASGAREAVTFQVQIGAGVTNTLLVNRALLDDGRGVRQANASTVIGKLHVYLPLVLRRWPPIPDVPVLNTIAPPGANPSYTVSWNAVYLASSYVLEQATNINFSDATQVYAGAATSKIIRSEGIATYHYRVKARNGWGDSGWSNVQTVEVRWEREPNNTYTEATGPLLSGKAYYGYPSDEKDYFSLFMPTRGTIVVELTGHVNASAEHKPQLLLYYRVPQDGGQVRRVYEPPYRLEYTGDPGQYYIYVFTPTESVSDVAPYTLRVTYP